MRTGSVTSLAVMAVLAAAVPARGQTLSAMVPAADGVKLATDVYCPLPDCVGRWPVVLQRTPYGKDSLGQVCTLFNLLGLTCVVQDQRGTGASEGTFTAFPDEASDGHAALAWLDAQPWCDGNVGTFGPSALALTQYAMAPGAPPALKCQVPIVGTPDIYHHAAVEGGAMRYGLAWSWLHELGADALYGELQQHRLWSDWWQERSVLPHVGEINVPGLHIGGWFDIFTQGTIDAFVAEQHHGGPGAVGRQKLIMGPWTHYNTGLSNAGAVDFPDNANLLNNLFFILQDWYGQWLEGEDNGVEAWPPVQVYLMGALDEAGAPGNTWVPLADWPPPAPLQPFYLSASGGLAASPPAAGEAALTSDPADPVPTWGGRELLDDFLPGGAPGSGMHDQAPIETRSDVQVFTSPTLSHPVTAMGRVVAHVWVRPDTLDLDLAVRLTDVYPDGRSMLIADGIQRARMRCADDRECFLTPGVPVELAVDLWSTAYVFNAGHRVRIDVSGSNWPRFEVNPNDGGDLNQPGPGVVAHPAILVGPAYPSRIDLPTPSLPRPPRRRLAAQ
jgi:predicted acyl esterase